MYLNFNRVGGAAAIATLLGAASACSGATDSGDTGTASGGRGFGGRTNYGGAAGAPSAGGTRAYGGSSFAGSAAGGVAGAGTPGISFGGVVGSAGASGALGSAGSTACSAETRAGKRVPLDMYFLVDSSGSMAEDVNSGNKWELVSSALADFLSDPRSADLGTGIGYFPDTESLECSALSDDCLCFDFLGCFSTSSGSCSAADYAEPAVTLAVTSNSKKVVASLQSRLVDGGTPTRPALEGALQYLESWASRHPERKPVLVLTTDGEPTECDANTPEDVAAVAAAALKGRYAIKTFVIGVGESLESLDLVARAGGTEHAFLVDADGDVTTALDDALEKIRGAAASCDFVIPSSGDAGEKVDPNAVNVRYTPTKGGTSAIVPQVAKNNAKNCGASGGWYYDDPQSPSLIRLCESTCATLNAGSIAIEFGCETVTETPR